MYVLLWIVLAIAVMYIARLAILAYVGTHAAPEISGAAYLRKELAKLEISTSQVPDECIADLVQLCKRTAEFQSYGSKKFTTSFVEGLDVAVGMVQIWLVNPSESNFPSFDGRKDIYREIFERHQIGPGQS